MRTMVFIPTYNEAENIGPLADALFGLGLPGLEVLVVDDASPDGTADRVRGMQARHPGLKLLVRGGAPGRGLAGREGFLACLQAGADAAVEMDGDFSHDPRFVPSLLKALEGADLAVGSRRAPGGSDMRSWPRRWLTRAANAYARAVLGLSVLDTNSGFRAFGRRALEAVDPATLRSQGPSVVHEALFRVARAGLRVVEVPIVFKDRERGETKLSLPRLLAGFLWILRLRFAQ